MYIHSDTEYEFTACPILSKCYKLWKLNALLTQLWCRSLISVNVLSLIRSMVSKVICRSLATKWCLCFVSVIFHLEYHTALSCPRMYEKTWLPVKSILGPKELPLPSCWGYSYTNVRNRTLQQRSFFEVTWIKNQGSNWLGSKNESNVNSDCVMNCLNYDFSSKEFGILLAKVSKCCVILVSPTFQIIETLHHAGYGLHTPIPHHMTQIKSGTHCLHARLLIRIECATIFLPRVTMNGQCG